MIPPFREGTNAKRESRHDTLAQEFTRSHKYNIYIFIIYILYIVIFHDSLTRLPSLFYIFPIRSINFKTCSKWTRSKPIGETIAPAMRAWECYGRREAQHINPRWVLRSLRDADKQAVTDAPGLDFATSSAYRNSIKILFARDKIFTRSNKLYYENAIEFGNR